MTMQFSAAEDFAKQLDAEDPLRALRDKFHLPLGKDGKPLIYFAGNSLGLMPKAARQVVDQELDDWAKLGVDAHLGLGPKDALILASPRKGEFGVRTEDIVDLIEQNADQLAVVLIAGVNFFTGQLFDIPTITKAAQKRGITVGVDLAHAIGNVPLSLHDWNVNFAVWCSYKYLDAGPGAVAGAYY